MFYDNHLWGMHLVWWFVWLMFLIWIFATPYPIPGRVYAIESPLNILKKRLASGEITNEEFHEKKRIMESV